MSRGAANAAAALAVLLAVAASVPAAAQPLAAAAAKHHRRHAARCRRGRAHVRIGRRSACIAVHGSPAADQLRARTLAVRKLDGRIRLRPRRHGATPRRPPRWAHSTALARAIDRGLRIAARMGSGAPIVAHARAASAGDPQPIHETKPFEQSGWKGEVEHDFGPMNGSATADADLGFEERTVVRAHKGGAQEVIEQVERIAIAQCPEVSGRVPGTHTWRFSDSASGPAGDGTYSRLYAEHARTKITGHTTDDGHVRDYDLDMRYVSNLQAAARDSHGRIVAADPPKVYALDFSRHGLHLLDYEDFRKGRSDPAFGEILDGGFDVGMANGPEGSFVSGLKRRRLSPGAADQFQTATRRFALAELRASNLLGTLESAWRDGACLRVDLSSTDLPLPHHKDLAGNDQPDSYTAVMRPGRSAHLIARVARPQGGALAPGTYAISATRAGGGDAGSVAPSGGGFAGSPLPFLYTAPARGWTRREDTVTLSVRAKSHQGQALAVVYISPAADRYELVFTHSSRLDYAGPPEQVAAAPATGTEDRHESWSVTSTIPLSGDPRTGLSGSAPISYRGASFHQRWEGTFTGQAACTGSETIDLTSTAPGTARVVRLTFSSPTGAALDFSPGRQAADGPSERDHDVLVFPNGPCQGADNTYTAWRWLGDFSYVYGRNGMLGFEPDLQVARIDSGWHAGQGDVLATRTVASTFPFMAPPGGSPSTSTWRDTYAIVRRAG